MPKTKPREANWRDALKDFAPLVLSCIALVISAATALFTVVLQLDDLRVVVGSRPQLSIDDKDIMITGRQELTLINSGTRAIALNSLAAVAYRLRSLDDKYRDCIPPDSEPAHDTEDAPAPRRVDYRIPLDFTPVVLKPGDITVVSATPVARGFWKPRIRGGIEIPIGWYKPREDDVFLVCLYLYVVTPDSVTTRWNRPLFLVPVSSQVELKQGEELFDKERPMSVLKRISPVWHRYFNN